jgi:hypothetical protein
LFIPANTQAPTLFQLTPLILFPIPVLRLYLSFLSFFSPRRRRRGVGVRSPLPPRTRDGRTDGNSFLGDAATPPRGSRFLAALTKFDSVLASSILTAPSVCKYSSPSRFLDCAPLLLPESLFLFAHVFLFRRDWIGKVGGGRRRRRTSEQLRQRAATRRHPSPPRRRGRTDGRRRQDWIFP